MGFYFYEESNFFLDFEQYPQICRNVYIYYGGIFFYWPVGQYEVATKCNSKRNYLYILIVFG